MRRTVNLTKTSLAFGLAIGTMVGLLAAPGRASADITTCCGKQMKWYSTDAPVFKVSPVSFPANSVQRHWLFQAAAGWNNSLGDLDFVLVDDDDHQITTQGDGNEIAFVQSNTVAPTRPLALAITSVEHYSCNSACKRPDILEVNIRFFLERNLSSGITPIAWDFSALTAPHMDAFAPGNLLFSLVASHEFGHAAGLAHSAYGMARMESSPPHGGWTHSTTDWQRVMPLAPDVADKRTLYPVGLAAGGDGSPYAINHQHMWSGDPENELNSVPLSWEWSSNTYGFFPRNSVFRNFSFQNARAGDQVTFQLCWGNRWPAPYSGVPASIILSSDSTLNTSAGDFLIGSKTLAAGGTAIGARCEATTVTIPAGIPAGTYFFGYELMDGNPALPYEMVLDRKLTIVP